jgi:hypothetical protein
VAGYKRIARLSNQEIERRLEEAPADIPTKDLAVISGIASDKIARYEQWGSNDDDGTGFDRFAELAERVMAGGGATLTVKLEPSDQDQTFTGPAAGRRGKERRQ